MDYGKLLARAFEITYKYRVLWLFGFLLALFGGSNGSNFNFPSSPGGGGSGRGSGGDVLPAMPDVFREFWQNAALFIALICCFVIVLVIISIVVRFISRAALIGLVQELEIAGTNPTIRRGFSIGADRFWSQLGIAIVINLPLIIISLVLVLVAVAPIFIAVYSAISTGRDSPSELWGIIGASIFGSLVLICCVTIFLMVIYLVVRPFYEFMLRVCVIGRRGVMDSIREGYRLVRANLGNVAVLYILVIGIGIGFGILMIPVALILIAIPVGAAVAFNWMVQSWQSAFVLGACLLIPLVLLLFFISGLFQVFESAVWTEGYLAITAPKLPSNAPATTT